MLTSGLTRYIAPSILLLAIAVLYLTTIPEEGIPVPHQNWSFSGPFGTYDRASAQRGWQVYDQVCSNCHGMKLAYYRNLEGIGFSPAQVKAIAASKTVPAIADDGSETTRPALPSDHFHAPFANEQAARTAMNGALPPDQSTLEKARPGGADYIYSLVGLGYVDPPAGYTVPDGKYYNKYFPGHLISMPPPLSDGVVTYDDGTQATVPQMAHDVATFLTYMSHPNMEERKQIGVKVFVYLVLLTVLAYLVKRHIWRKVH